MNENWKMFPELVYGQVVWWAYALCATLFVGVLVFGSMYTTRPF